MIIAGDHQPPVVHALAHAINQVLGNVGKTVFYTDPVDANPVNQIESLKDLVADMQAGKVDLLIILGGNPVYDAPADLNFADALKSSKVQLRVHLRPLSGRNRRTLPMARQRHARTRSLGRCPGLRRHCQHHPAADRSSLQRQEPDRIRRDALRPSRCDRLRSVRAYWQKQHTGADFEQFWRKSLHDGWIDGTTSRRNQVTAKSAISRAPASKAADANAIELNIRRDPTIYDGQFANNGWLQELPKPMSKLTWDNAVSVGPKMAQRLQLAIERRCRTRTERQESQGAVWIQAGHPDNSITITLGYGRKRAGRVGTGAGLQHLRTPHQRQPWIARV